MFQWRTHTLTTLICTLTPMVAAADEEISPLNGKDLSNWTTKEPTSRSHWKIGTASLNPQDEQQVVARSGGNHLINTAGRGVDIYTLQKFSDVRIELEVMVPKGSNSGIYVMGEYEVQVFDSFGKEKLNGGDMGAIYGAAPPRTNAQTQPGIWNKYVIEFRAPRFDNTGKRTEKARFTKVELNGKTLHENVEMDGPTPSGVTGRESAAGGPLMLQGDHGPVAFRNITIQVLKRL
ncbi:MAG TPA: DUF1080 domain-containing protein [Rhodopirellula sp.]|nr:DUF1080 domain-containing protein [Rhodopirellula sp.]